MKDNRFIELVNLYVDRQITADETAELETEVQGSPRRRAIYRQYCQMHRATKLAYDSFRVSATEHQPAHPAGRNVIARFESRRRMYRWTYCAAGLAAAACLALVFVRLNSPQPATAGLMAKAEQEPSAQMVAAVPAPAPKATEPTTGLASLRQNVAVEDDYTALLMALRQEEQRAFASGHIQPGRMPSLFDDGVFESQQVLPTNSQRVFRGKQTPAQQAEFTAFQFQR